MSLFHEIRRLCQKESEQTEDILTEIVAEVLRNDPELTKSWLTSLRIEGGSEARIHSVETQYRLPGLPDHETDSRIDLVIRFSTPRGTVVVFVESKVGSGEGYNQLQRYADLLQEECKHQAADGMLVFVTRDFEATTKPDVNEWNIGFHQTRWFQFYNILKSRSSSDGLEKQLMLFMEENHMSVGNQFRSTDLVALENFRGAKALMDETLCEAVDRMRKFGGKVGLNKAMTRLRIFGEYKLVLKFHGFEVLLGYCLPAADSNEGVWLDMVILSDPKTSNRPMIIDAITKWLQKKGEAWESWDLADPSKWSGAARGKSLRAFQPADDQVKAIKLFFNELLEELEEFRKMFPNLPWTPEESNSSDDET